MTTKHTPGPWHVGMKQAERIVYDSTGWAVANATVYHGRSDAAEVMANARLIAAAPELLRDLKSAIFYIETYGGEVTKSFAAGGNLDSVKRVIAKAEGE